MVRAFHKNKIRSNSKKFFYTTMLTSLIVSIVSIVSIVGILFKKGIKLIPFLNRMPTILTLIGRTIYFSAMITNICVWLTWLPGVVEGGPWTVVGENTCRPARLLSRDMETPESRLENTGSSLEASASMFEGSAFRMGASFSRQEPSGPRLEAGPRARLWEAVV